MENETETNELTAAWTNVSYTVNYLSVLSFKNRLSGLFIDIVHKTNVDFCFWERKEIMPHFIRLSIDMAQMFLHRLSKLLVVCCIESHSVSLAQASESCSKISHILKTDSTPAVCCSISRCRSYIHEQKTISSYSMSFIQYSRSSHWKIKHSISPKTFLMIIIY